MLKSTDHTIEIKQVFYGICTPHKGIQLDAY